MVNIEVLLRLDIMIEEATGRDKMVLVQAKEAVGKRIAKPMARITGMERVAEVYQEEVCPVCRAKPHYFDDLYCANCGQRLGV